MEAQENVATVTTRSVGIRFGLISGVLSIAYFLVMTLTGMNMTTGPGKWAGFLFTIVILVFAHKYYKDNGDSFMSFPQGLGIGAWMGLVSGVLSSVFTYFYIKFVDASFMEAIMQTQRDEMQAKGMSDEQIDQAMKFATMFTSPEAILVFGIIGGVFSCFIIALIVGIFTQKKNPDATIA